VILYEMLAGRPVYPFSLRAEAEVAHDVLHAELSAINRPDLKNIPQVVERAVSKDYRRRQPDVLALARELQVSVPPVPKEGKNARNSWRTLAIVLAAAIAVMALLLLAAASGR
jgi:hypothetical protein